LIRHRDSNTLKYARMIENRLRREKEKTQKRLLPGLWHSF
jgi:hypothetical protein